MNRTVDFDRTKLKDSMGRFKTNSLFFELNQMNEPALFTLKEHDHSYNGNDYLSLKKMYLEFDDPTEYEFAIAVFGSWRHWQRLCNNNMLKPYIEEWRNEQEIKLRSQAIRSIIGTAITEGAKGTTAAKWVAEGSWKGKEGSTRGRPSKEELERTKKIHAGIESDIEDDLTRIGVSH